MNERRARELVARERARIKSALAALGGEIHAQGSLQRQQTGDSADAASTLDAESITGALEADLREQLAAVERAEERIARGSVRQMGREWLPIPDERLEVEPLAERTVEEQRQYEMDEPKRLRS